MSLFIMSIAPLKTVGAVTLALLLGGCTATAPKQVDQPKNLDHYPQQLLDLALEKGGLQWARNEHIRGKDIDVLWGDESVVGFTTLDVPLMRGLNDYWVLLIQDGSQKRFDTIRNWWDLNCFTGGAFLNDPVAKALQAHGVSTRVLPEDADPAQWMNDKKLDFVLVSALEAQNHVTKSKGRLSVENRLAFNHHHPYRFHVRDGDDQLMDYLRVGLTVAEKDETFESLFLHFYAPTLKQLQLQTRRIFRLPGHGQTNERLIKSACSLKLG